MYEEFADGLNLDGIGVQNYSVRVTSYANQNNIFDSYVVLEVMLNQDETIQKNLPGITNNYGVSDVYAYEVVKNNGRLNWLKGCL